jgi:hypothetical protein
MNNTIRTLVQVPYAFVLMNVAVLTGLFHFVRGHEGFWNSVQMGTTNPRRLRHT